METIRSFIAIEMAQTIRVRLGDLLRDLKRTEADCKWVRPEGIHLTLKFLGEVSSALLEKIGAAVEPAVAVRPSFAMRIRGLGTFPSGRNPRVIWAGIDQGADDLCELQKAVEEKTAELGFPPEGRPFSPHLTLGRLRSPRGRDALLRTLTEKKDLEIGVFQAATVILFKSELKPSGAVYTKLRIFPMRENGEE